jgi:hypothetical protein
MLIIYNIDSVTTRIDSSVISTATDSGVELSADGTKVIIGTVADAGLLFITLDASTGAIIHSKKAVFPELVAKIILSTERIDDNRLSISYLGQTSSLVMYATIVSILAI